MMTKKLFAMSALMIVGLTSAGISPLTSADEPKQGVEAFMACYTSDIPDGMVGAPVQTINVLVDVKPEHQARGAAKVEWASVPGFKPITARISGPWYWMCTMQSCSFRFDYTSAPGAKGIKGMLVAPNWGQPGTFIYEFEGHGQVEQKAKVCN
jgi:hypothetical protein